MSAGNYYASQPLSSIKKAGLDLLYRIDTRAKIRIQNTAIRKFWDWFFVSHGKKVIMNMTDDELKQELLEDYKILKPIFDAVEMNQNVKESRNYNSGKMQQFVEAITPKDVMELL